MQKLALIFLEGKTLWITYMIERRTFRSGLLPISGNIGVVEEGLYVLFSSPKSMILEKPKLQGLWITLWRSS